MQYIEEILEIKILRMPEDPQIIGALGAAIFAHEKASQADYEQKKANVN